MPEPAAAPGPAAADPAVPPHRGRPGRVAWRIGWVLLAAVSLGLTYATLVVIGR